MTLNQRGLLAAIIDLDGTLIDTVGDFVQAINLTLTGLGLPPSGGLDRFTVERMVGKGSEHLIRSVLDHVGAPSQYEAAFAGYQLHYASINGSHAVVYPGALEGLRELQKAGLPLACLTNKPLAFAQELLRLKGLDGFFVKVYGGDSFERKKPDPLPLRRTCEALDTPPAQTLMVGDSSNDAQAARGAGCPVVLVTYGYNHGEPVGQVEADGFVDSLADLAVLLGGSRRE